MASSEARDGYILLSDKPGDTSRVQMILAEWGMDEATINLMLKEQQLDEATFRRERARDHRIDAAAGHSPVAH